MQISTAAREIFFRANEVHRDRSPDFDKELLHWLDTEYELFRAIEVKLYGERVNEPFKSIDELIEFANELLNRRKSRAGRSLENHLHEVFSLNGLSFSHPCRTEGNKLPDFIFPGRIEYLDGEYASDKLVFLGAKTTCKDRWRQILNEADRIPVKHLFTLQQGISKNQLEEMRQHHVVLVVPRVHITSFPKDHRPQIMTLMNFIAYVKARQC
jgi:type II restriction enzyme